MVILDRYAASALEIVPKLSLLMHLVQHSICFEVIPDASSAAITKVLMHLLH